MNIDDRFLHRNRTSLPDWYPKVGNYPQFLRIDGESGAFDHSATHHRGYDMLNSGVQHDVGAVETEIQRDHGNRYCLRRRRTGTLPCQHFSAARGNVGLVLRVILHQDSRAGWNCLRLKAVEQICDMPRGLVLVTGV